MNLLKKLKLTDYIIILVILILAGVGTFVVIKKKNFANLPVEKETAIQFDVFFRGITISDNKIPFEVDKDAFITIRNVPYTKLKITAIDGRQRMTTVAAANEAGFIIAPDASTPNLFDFIVKLEDKAKKTPDGYVVGGNKLKMGIPVVIEGERYRYSGTVSNIQEIDEIQNSEQPQPVEEPIK
ncbi:MAG: DUF4330 domain-containing protein [Candidatus Gastranaerophilales bacterium]|nr:DUF4330 domain-containing protein [Candidatus Gastranaerophilales bacterium]